MQKYSGGAMDGLMKAEDRVLAEMHDVYRQKLQTELQAEADAAQEAFLDANTIGKRRYINMVLITTLGKITLRVMKGRCPTSGEWQVPIRGIWGLSGKQMLSPSLQKKLCATACETGSFEKASRLAAQWGTDVSDDAIRSCVQKLGEEALYSPMLSPCTGSAQADDVLIIMMDGWMARHRGLDWGKRKHTKAQQRVSWHEIKSAIIYKLKDHVRTKDKRSWLISKHAVAVPAETDPVDFAKRVHDEAKRMGLGQAKHAYIVMDGGVWLWNIFEERFSLCATGTLDFYHASEHIHALANVLFKDDPGQSASWAVKILHSLKHHSPKRLFRTLEQLIDNPPDDAALVSDVKKTYDYFQNHKDHMDYPDALKAGLPIGSGSIESQCSQFQNRFKRRGQFWSKHGFAALMEVYVRYQNNEISSLWAA